MRIIVQRGKSLVFTEDVKKVSKLNEFNNLGWESTGRTQYQLGGVDGGNPRHDR